MAKNKNKKVRSLTFIAELLLFFLAVILIFIGVFYQRIYPGVIVAKVNLSGLRLEEAKDQLAKQVIVPQELTLTINGQLYEIDSSEIAFSYDLEKSAEKAFLYHRTGNVLFDIANRLVSPFKTIHLGLDLTLDEAVLDAFLKEIAADQTKAPVYPAALVKDGALFIERGEKGEVIDLKSTKAAIAQRLSLLDKGLIELVVTDIDPMLEAAKEEVFRERAQTLFDKTLILELAYFSLNLNGAELLSLLNPQGGFDESAVSEIISEAKTSLNRAPQNPIFVFNEDTLKVQEFAPAKDGIKVQEDDLKERIIGNLKKLEEKEEKIVTVKIPVEKTPPDFDTGDVNRLGIRELIGRGTSTYRGSIASRVHNIALASSRFSGILIPPGETFSFNQALGDVSAYTGYRKAYIIRDGQTVLGDGGGVCQVSTTLFRAILDAGLPIVERRAHSYRVSYYEQGSPVGYDATVFAPTTDFKFKNDTPAHLLIQTFVDPGKSFLAFEIYGTKDDRKVKVGEPVITSTSSPPEDLYIDDPTLPSGVIKQIDYRAWGARVQFNYEVDKNGEVYQETFYSNYRPWQAKFLRGTGPVNE